MLSNIRVAFHYMDKEIMIKLVTCMVRQRLEYAADLATMITNESTHTREHLRKTEKSQRSENVKKFSFPHRTVDMWNVLREQLVEADSIHTFKKLVKFRYGDRT